MMKKLTGLLLAVLMLAAMLPVTAFAAESGVYGSLKLKEGSGTADDPYLIRAYTQLMHLAEETNKGTSDFAGVYFKLAANVAFMKETAPIGTKEHPFKGNFDGGGYSIQMILTEESQDYVGLFGYAVGSQFKDITVRPVVGSSRITGNDYVGAICGYLEGGSITGCTSGAEINGNTFVGGICGYLGYGSITDCNNTGAVNGSEFVGKICGCLEESSISNAGDVGGDDIVGGDLSRTAPTANVTLVTPDMTAWGAQDSETPLWYAVSGTVTLTVRPEVLGNVRLILCNNSVLNAPKGITLEEGNTLTVFAPSNGDAMGKLVIESFDGNMINLDRFGRTNKGADAAIGGRGGSSGQNDGEGGGSGTSAGALCWRDGSLTVTAPNGACIGGGNGGNAADADDNGNMGGGGGNGADVSVYGGVISLDGASGISGGNAGNCSTSLEFGPTGGAGGNGRSFVVYDGIVTIHSTKGVCVGGGSGGRGSNIAHGGGSDGGNGGNGGTVTFNGGTVTMASEVSSCISGGTGGAGGEGAGIDDATVTNSSPGSPGKAAVLTVNSGATVAVGSDEATVQTILVTSTLTTDSNDEAFKNKTYCKIFFAGNSAGNSTASVLSEGNLWIIIAIPVLTIGTVAALLIVKKKKKTAVAERTENEGEE